MNSQATATSHFHPGTTILEASSGTHGIVLTGTNIPMVRLRIQPAVPGSSDPAKDIWNWPGSGGWGSFQLVPNPSETPALPDPNFPDNYVSGTLTLSGGSISPVYNNAHDTNYQITKADGTVVGYLRRVRNEDPVPAADKGKLAWFVVNNAAFLNLIPNTSPQQAVLNLGGLGTLTFTVITEAIPTAQYYHLVQPRLPGNPPQ